MLITRPFEIIKQSTEYDVRCSVKGGGPQVKLVQWCMVYQKHWFYLMKI